MKRTSVINALISAALGSASGNSVMIAIYAVSTGMETRYIVSLIFTAIFTFVAGMLNIACSKDSRDK